MLPNLITVSQPTRRFLRLPSVEDRTGHKKSWLYAAILAGKFPAPHKYGKTSLWLEEDVDRWIVNVVEGRETA